MAHRIIYLSHARKPLDRQEIGQILETSRRNNARDDITGLLIVHDGRFFQALEGRKAQILNTYVRIKRDSRHGDITRIFDEPVSNRAFPEWRMGFAEPSDLDEDLRDSVTALWDLVPLDSADRGEDPVVRQAVREFMEGLGPFYLRAS